MSFSGKETKIDWIQVDGKRDYFYHPKYPDIKVKRDENITEIQDTKNIKMGFVRLVCHKDKINPVVFKRCTFEQINFNKEKELELNCGVAFENCIFHRTTDFSNIIFHNNVSFKGTVFEGRVYFNNTIFNKRADFSKIKARKTTAGGFYFKADKLPNLTSDSEIIFDNAVFETPVFFTNRYFIGKVSFDEVVFKNAFDFSGVKLGTKAKLSNINIDYENIKDVEQYIRPLVNILQNEGYLQMARDLQSLMKKLYKATPKLFKLDYNNISGEDKKTIISRKETSLIIGVPIGTLKTWENRKCSTLKFIKKENKTGYTLANIKEYLQQNPPKKKLYYDMLNSSADEIAVKSIFTVSLDAFVSDVLEKMVSNEYTHIPVLQNGIIQGVFSENAFISYLIHHKITELKLSDIKISDLKNEIDLSSNSCSFVFIKAKTPLFKVRQMFVNALEEQKRLGAIFITDNGKENGVLQGLVTSWDIAGL